jgi:hypothetical protein
MKKIILMIAVILFVDVHPTWIRAERTTGSITIGAFSGIGLPFKPDHFKNGWKSDLGFGAEIRYHFSAMNSISVCYTYQSFKLDQEQYLKEKGRLLGAKWKVTGGGAFKISVLSLDFTRSFIPPTSRFDLYASAGGGYYLLKPEDVQVDITYIVPPFTPHATKQKNGEPENKLGIDGGLGLEIQTIKNLILWIEGKAHLIFTKTDQTSFIQVVSGLKLRL